MSASQIAEVQISSSEIGQKFFTLKEPAPLTSLNSSSRKTTGKCFKMLSLDTGIAHGYLGDVQRSLSSLCCIARERGAPCPSPRHPPRLSVVLVS